MSNIVKFPKDNGQEEKYSPAINMDKIKSAMPKASTVKGVLSWVWLIIRLPLFLVMYWLRLPIIFLCNIISIPLLLCWLFAWYAFPDKTAMVWSFGTVSFLAFVIGWTYDFILMALSPQDMMRSL